jgi:hypothetical protein
MWPERPGPALYGPGVHLPHFGRDDTQELIENVKGAPRRFAEGSRIGPRRPSFEKHHCLSPTNVDFVRFAAHFEDLRSVPEEPPRSEHVSERLLLWWLSWGRKGKTNDPRKGIFRAPCAPLTQRYITIGVPACNVHFHILPSALSERFVPE